MTKPDTSRAISADEWRQIVDSAVGTAIITTDLEGRVTSWNEGASRMLGWTASDVLSHTLERLFPPGEGASALQQEMSDALTVHNYEKFPFDIVGWDGSIYPIAFNIHDYQPKTGMVHLPPTIHTTFAGNGFVICSFVPRMTDTHPQGIPCPYGHASVDMDEILYYVDGQFTSRKGIDSESISLHPQGVPHGPHPGAYEASIGTKSTNELAVMMDCYKPLRLTTVAAGIEDLKYHTSWVRNDLQGRYIE